MPLVVLAWAVLPFSSKSLIRVIRLTLLAISSFLAISSENISTSCPACAILSATFKQKVVLPREDIAPIMYSPAYKPPSKRLSSGLKPVGIKAARLLSSMPFRKFWSV